MFIAYLAVTVAAAAMSGYAAYVDLAGADWMVENLDRYGVPRSWLPLLAILKAAAAGGLLVGIALPLLGSAAAIGLVAYFVGAILTVLRARCWSHIAYPLVCLLPPAASLALLLVSSTAV
jgi:hypothetical protein